MIVPEQRLHYIRDQEVRVKNKFFTRQVCVCVVTQTLR